MSQPTSLAPAPGVTPPPADGPRLLSNLIVDRGLVDVPAMKAALRATLSGRDLTEILLEHDHLGEDDLARVLADHHGLDHIDLEAFTIDPQAIALVGQDVARRLRAVPIAFLASGAAVVAVGDPNETAAAVEIAALTGREIQRAIVAPRQIEALIEALEHVAGGPAASAFLEPADEPMHLEASEPVHVAAYEPVHPAAYEPAHLAGFEPRHETPHEPVHLAAYEPMHEPAAEPTYEPAHEPVHAPAAGSIEPPRAVAQTIDIAGDPGVPWVRALAPMASDDPPRGARRPQSDRRGLRRTIGSRRRG